MKLISLFFKKIIYIFSAIHLSFASLAYNGGNPYYELFSLQKRQTGSVRYQSNGLKSNFGKGGIKSNKLMIFTQIKSSNKTQVLLNIPYKTINIETTKAEITQKSGVGDIQAMLVYQVKDNLWDSTFNGNWHQKILIGGGLKSPTGAYEKANIENTALNPISALGTGSWDYLLAANYTARNQEFGLNFDMQYQVNNQNSYKFQQGNTLSHTAQIFYCINSKNTNITTRIGSKRAYFDENSNQGQIDQNSGGWLWAASAGVDVYYKNLGLNIGYLQPLNQVLLNNQYKITPASNIGLMWLF